MTRRSRLLGAALVSLVCVLLCAAPALANHPIGPSEREDPGENLTAAETLGLFVLLPALILAVIAAAAWLPGAVRGPRYRPTRGWDAPPVWFSGPPAPVEAVAAAQTGDVTRGGASGSW